MDSSLESSAKAIANLTPSQLEKLPTDEILKIYEEFKAVDDIIHKSLSTVRHEIRDRFSIETDLKKKEFALVRSDIHSVKKSINKKYDNNYWRSKSHSVKYFSKLESKLNLQDRINRINNLDTKQNFQFDEFAVQFELVRLELVQIQKNILYLQKIIHLNNNNFNDYNNRYNHDSTAMSDNNNNDNNLSNETISYRIEMIIKEQKNLNLALYEMENQFFETMDKLNSIYQLMNTLISNLNQYNQSILDSPMYFSSLMKKMHRMHPISALENKVVDMESKLAKMEENVNERIQETRENLLNISTLVDNK